MLQEDIEGGNPQNYSKKICRDSSKVVEIIKILKDIMLVAWHPALSLFPRVSAIVKEQKKKKQ